MNEVIREWIQKAEGDFRTAEREFAAAQEPNFDAVCFHSQQCVEKLLKAILIREGVAPPRTHDLVFIAGQTSSLLQLEIGAVSELRFLSRAAVAFRYPGESAEREEAAEALRIAGEMKGVLLAALTAG